MRTTLPASFRSSLGAVIVWALGAVPGMGQFTTNIDCEIEDVPVEYWHESLDGSGQTNMPSSAGYCGVISALTDMVMESLSSSTTSNEVATSESCYWDVWNPPVTWRIKRVAYYHGSINHYTFDLSDPVYTTNGLVRAYYWADIVHRVETNNGVTAYTRTVKETRELELGSETAIVIDLMPQWPECGPSSYNHGGYSISVAYDGIVLVEQLSEYKPPCQVPDERYASLGDHRLQLRPAIQHPGDHRSHGQGGGGIPAR